MAGECPPPPIPETDSRPESPSEIDAGTAEVYRLVASAARVAADRPVPLGAGRREPDAELAAAIGRAEQRIESLITSMSDGDDERPVVLASRLTELLSATGDDGQVHRPPDTADERAAAQA